jgi:putative Holliday junction resolvase
MHKTILGVDFGLRHIGIAIGQSITQTATPLTTLKARDGVPNWAEIETLIQKWQPTDLVVGIPLQLDGSTQPMTFCAKRFINKLRARFKLPTHEVDERLSTWEAKTRAPTKIIHHPSKAKAHQDNMHAIAAVVLVEQWIAKL